MTTKRTDPISNEVFEDIHDLALNGKGPIYGAPMIYNPNAWKSAPKINLSWTAIDFPPDKKSDVPKKPGVYIFVVMPDIFSFPEVSGLLYIGKTTSLYERIGAYLSEINSRFNSTKRPAVWRMLNVWHGHLRYFYTITPTEAAAKALEDQMLALLKPPFNKTLPATINKKMSAF